MNRRHIMKFAVSLAAAVSLMAIDGGHAVLAATPPPQVPQSLRTNCETAITDRLATLNSNVAYINSVTALTAAHRAALLAIANNDIAGLTALEPKIATDWTIAQTLSDCGEILSGYRVYILLEPQGWEVITADQVVAAVDNVQPAVTAIQAAVNASNVSAAVKAQAQSALNDISTRLHSAQSDVAGVADEALAQTPAGYPGNLHVLVDGLTSLQNASNELPGIAADLQTLANLQY